MPLIAYTAFRSITRPFGLPDIYPPLSRVIRQRVIHENGPSLPTCVEKYMLPLFRKCLEQFLISSLSVDGGATELAYSSSKQ